MKNYDLCKFAFAATIIYWFIVESSIGYTPKVQGVVHTFFLMIATAKIVWWENENNIDI